MRLGFDWVLTGTSLLPPKSNQPAFMEHHTQKANKPRPPKRHLTKQPSSSSMAIRRTQGSIQHRDGRWLLQRQAMGYLIEVECSGQNRSFLHRSIRFNIDGRS